AGPGRLERRVARLLDQPGDAVHGPVERFRLVPVAGARRPVPDARDAVGVDGELVGGGPLGAERPLADRAFRVALDVDDAAVADVDELAAADGAVGADTGHFADAVDLEVPRLRPCCAYVEAQAQQAAQGEAAGGGFQKITTAEVG